MDVENGWDEFINALICCYLFSYNHSRFFSSFSYYFWDGISCCSPAWSDACCVAQAVLNSVQSYFSLPRSGILDTSISQCAWFFLQLQFDFQCLVFHLKLEICHIALTFSPYVVKFGGIKKWHFRKIKRNHDLDHSSCTFIIKETALWPAQPQELCSHTDAHLRSMEQRATPSCMLLCFPKACMILEGTANKAGREYLAW